MELFRETLATTLMRKRAELAAIAATLKKNAKPADADAIPPPEERLDFSTSKTLRAMQEFEAERRKRSKKQVKEETH
jgi:histidine ammonia-lyase